MTDILVNQDNGGMEDDLNIPITQGITSEGQQAHVEVQPSRNTKGSKRTKNFDWKEDEVICSGWLNVSKDPINGANQSVLRFGVEFMLSLRNTSKLQL